MTINYTTLLGLAKPVTGTETGQWGDVVNDEITSLLEDAVANAATFSVTVGDVTLSTTNGASNQARMSTLIITGSPGILRNVIVPSQAKIYVVINQANAEVVIKGAATTGVTVGAGQTAQIAWNGSDFVEIGNYVHGNFVVNGNLSVNGNSTLGDGGADTTTINGQFIGANSNISKATTVSTSAPALAWVKGATYTDTASSGGTTQAHAPFTLLSAPTLATSNIVTYTNASTFYIAGAPSASGSATITNPYAMYVAAGEAYLAGAVTMAATTQNLALGTSQTSGTWTAGGAAQTGALTLDQSTKTHTLNLGTGATESAATKTVNIGTAGVSGSTTAVNIGSAVSGATNNVTINGNPTFNSGTANGVLYLNGSKVATSGSALTFDGTNFATTGRATANDFVASGSAYYTSVGGTTYGSLVATAGTLTLNANNGTGLIFSVASTEGMRLTSTGLGIGTSSPGAKLHVSNGSNSDSGDFTAFVFGGTDATNSRTASFIKGTSTPYNTIFRYQNNTGTTTGSLIFQNGSTEQMRLDSSGNLGIGTSSPVYKLVVSNAGAQGFEFDPSAGIFQLYNRGTSAYGSMSQYASQIRFFTGSSPVETMRLDSSGNLGLGVTPSASAYKTFEETGIAITGINSQDGRIYGNSYESAGGAVYKTTGAATLYRFGSGIHYWYNAASGTAGNAISFTQAMTLNSSGSLVVGSTTANRAGANTGISVEGASTSILEANVNASRAGYLYSDAATTILGEFRNFPLVFRTNDTERARITSGGDLGIGTSSPGSKLDVQGNALIGDGTDRTPNSNWNGQLNIRGNSYTGGISLNATGMWVGHNSTARDLIFATDETERARITSGGDLLVGTTGSLISSGSRLRVTTGGGPTIDAQSTNVGNAVLDAWNSATSGDNLFQRFWTEGTATQRGSIDYNRAGGLVRYNTTSDYRAKDIIGPVQNPGAIIDALKVYEGKMKGATQSRPMLIAHEAQAHAPYAVSGVKDEVNEDGTPKFQQMDVSSLVPLLLAEIQSLRARVAALEAA